MVRLLIHCLVLQHKRDVVHHCWLKVHPAVTVVGLYLGETFCDKVQGKNMSWPGRSRTLSL